MIRKTLILITSLLFLLSARQETADITGSGEIRFEGTVQTPEGEPLSAVTVEVEGYRAETDADGRFILDGIQPELNVISITGREGTGQYIMNLDQSQDGFIFEYPVVTTVVFLHDNDLHFNFNYRDEFEAKVEEIRERYENVWLLNGGDTFVRHADRWATNDTSYYADQSRFMIDTMNEVGYDLGVPGNHEMDYVGTHTGQSLKAAGFPLIAANIDVSTGILPQFKPFTILETNNGLSIAVLGLSTVNFDKPGVTQRDYSKTIQAYSNLAAENDLFMVLSHIGLNSDEMLAESFPVLDLIIGGHSHNLLETAKMVNGVLIAQAGGPPPRHQIDPEWPKYLGKVKVVFENGVITEKSGHVMTIGEPVDRD